MIKNEVIHKIIKGMVTYLSPYQLKKLKATLQDQLEDEDYIAKSPARRIHKVKTVRAVKEIFTDENIEIVVN